MSLSYNLRFRRMSPAGRVTLEKEGELVLYDKGFRLRGKGANDQGGVVSFSDIKELVVDDGRIMVHTFLKENFELSGIGSSFDQLVRDLYKVQNDFLVDALFLKQGKLISEFDAYFEQSNAAERDLGKGRAIVRLYDESVVIIPNEHDAFSLSIHFMTQQEFDDDEYCVKITMENGIVVMLSQFGSNYEDFQEQFYATMSQMYQSVINQLEYQFIEFNKEQLVKLAHLMRKGKAARMKEIAKIDKELAKKVEECIFKDEMFVKTIAPLRAKVDDEHLFIGLSVADGKKEIYKFIIIFALPSDNVMACTLGAYEKDIRKVQDSYFFRIVMEHGVAEDFVAQKVFEINQAYLLLNFVPDPFYKDKRELKNSIYKLAIRKLSYLRSLRASFLGRCPSILPELFTRNFDKVVAKSRVARGAPVSVELD